MQTNDGSSLHDATLDFQPSDPAYQPGRISVQDDGPGTGPYPVRFQSPSATRRPPSCSPIQA